MHLKEIFTGSFKFLFREWKIFCIVLIFYTLIFVSTTFFPKATSINSDPASITVNKAPYLLFYLVFWVSITPLIIIRANAYFENQQAKQFKIKDIKTNAAALIAYKTIFILLGLLISVLIALNYAPSIYLGTITVMEIFQFLLFLTPAVIVLENRKFFDSAKESISKIQANFKESIIFYLILALILSIFQFSGHIQMLSAAIIHEKIIIPGIEYLQLILDSGSFIFYNVAVIGFYLNFLRKNS